MDNAELVEAGAGDINPKKKKKDKVRSAWISFVGRIAAQLVGAIATVSLGVMVLHRYTSTETPAPTQAPVAVSAPGQPPTVHVIVITPAMLGLRNADEHIRAADRSCTPELDVTATSAAHADMGTLLPH